jgi:hydrogenase nickel incorporation protein HypB
VAVVSKMDLATACDFNRESVTTNLRLLAPKAPVFEVSAKSGKGMDAWCEFLVQQHKAIKARDPLRA